MSGRKRLPSTLMAIKSIYQGYIKDMGDQRYFMIGDSSVNKVRIYGVVLSRQDRVSRKGREFTTILLDDGSDTIGLTVWSYPTKEMIDGEEKVVYNPIDMVENVKNGDILDVIGRVREFNDAFFISPSSVSIQDDIEWEIHRRTQLVRKELEMKNLLAEERNIEDILAIQTQYQISSDDRSGEELSASMDEDEIEPFEQPELEENLPSRPQPEAIAVPEGDLKEKILATLSNDADKNTIDQISARLGIGQEQISKVINELVTSGEIFDTGKSRYLSLNASI